MAARSDREGFGSALAAEVAGLLEGQATPGAGCAVLVDGEAVFAGGVGWRDLERQHPLEGGARFYIYSLTKSLLAAAILQRVEAGQVDLDSPVQDYLPGLALERPVTLRQLLNHTGGLPDYGGTQAYNEALKAHPEQPWTPDQFLAGTLPGGLVFPPGQGWRYSNIGFLLLRLVLEGLADGSLQRALEGAIFRPLGLRETAVARDLRDAAVLSPGYSDFFNSDRSLEDIARVYHPGWVSHGVVISTPLETARMFDGIFGGLVPENRLAEMLVPVRVRVEHPLFKEPGYGLGLMIDPASPYGLLAGHGGGGPGYSAGALVLPDVRGRRISAAAIANRDQPDLGLQIAHLLASRAAGAAA
jgi:D-alanyl-D-alanine carboxypeptidase